MRTRAAAVLALGGGALLAGAAGLATTDDGPPSCEIVKPGIYVDLDDAKDAKTIDHARAAVRRGQPRILHLDRKDADAHRAASLRGIPTEPGMDRDEYPPAATVEGGAGADVAYVPPSDNRSAGAIMRAQLAPFCDGQAFVLEP